MQLENARYNTAFHGIDVKRNDRRVNAFEGTEGSIRALLKCFEEKNLTNRVHNRSEHSKLSQAFIRALSSKMTIV